MRIMTKSTLPPARPEIDPYVAPITRTIKAAVIPTVRETRPPYIVLAIMSLPAVSVPKTWGKIFFTTLISFAVSEGAPVV